MADLTITAASVKMTNGAGGSGTTPLPSTGTAGEAIAAGDSVYRKSSDLKMWKADANLSAEGAGAIGIALNAAGVDQPVTFFAEQGGDINLGATLVAGETYIVSVNAGKICPVGDLASGSWLTYLGYATSTSNLRLNIKATGVQK